MARISGITIPDNKKILFSLPYLYGIGPVNAAVILRTLGISPDKMTKDLTSEEIGKLQTIIDRNYKVEGDLRREITDNIKRLKEIGSWRGTRHARRLPLHGRTKTNSRTTRGNVRKTMGSGRKPTAQKT
jgi:small subunit ribosomal protein S13